MDLSFDAVSQGQLVNIGEGELEAWCTADLLCVLESPVLAILSNKRPILRSTWLLRSREVCGRQQLNPTVATALENHELLLTIAGGHDVPVRLLHG